MLLNVIYSTELSLACCSPNMLMARCVVAGQVRAVVHAHRLVERAHVRHLRAAQASTQQRQQQQQQPPHWRRLRDALRCAANEPRYRQHE